MTPEFKQAYLEARCTTCPVGPDQLEREEQMEKHIVRFSYWLAMVCLALALIMRVASLAGASFSQLFTKGNPVSYRTFLVGALLLFLVTIATRSYSESQ